MEHKKINRFIGVGVFAASLISYIFTLPPTVVFWDVGEFSAAAFSLQVPHPPGAPLFLLIGRIFSLLPISPDIAVRMHFISALSSALSVMFLYLISVRFISMWRGKPETTIDRVAVYGTSVIGALSLAFSKTFWFNAVEAEVYGLSMLFVSSTLWLALRWYERAEWERSDVYLLIIAYLIGLSVGVHLLALLVLFAVMLLFYFRHYEFSIESFIKFGVVSVLVFGVIYPGVVKWFPSLLDGELGGTQSVAFTFIPIIAVLGALFGIYHSARTHRRIVNVALLSFVLIVLGYSTYAVVYIRANAQPPMNENNPNNLTRLVSYLNREQYGTAPFMQRRYSDQPEHQGIYTNYTSDVDFLWRYQMNHMYLRYLGWNFIGAAGDWQEAGVDWKKLYGIPFFLALVGAYHHWRKDKQMAFVGTTVFLLLGIILVLYFNMQEPQPRERDYFYVGSFFIFSLWIGMGVLALIDAAKEKLGTSKNLQPVVYGILVVAFALAPVNMFRANFSEANRSGNWVPFDYSYNTLQSLEPDAILFTNGDNDTFPLWYLQDVEGIRRDVRVICLSLLNTNWYIDQLKNQEPYGAKKVPISLADRMIENVQPLFPYQAKQYEIPVPAEVIDQYAIKDTSITNRKVVSFFFPATLQYGEYSGLMVQDILVYDIVKTTNWKRPIYFAMTVADGSKIGLQEFLHWDGLAFKLLPKRQTSSWTNSDPNRMEQHLFVDRTSPAQTPELGFLWRQLDDGSVHLDDQSRRMMSNYRQAFLASAGYYLNVLNQPENVLRVLRRMEEVLPRSIHPMQHRLKLVVGNYYEFAGDKATFQQFMQELIDEITPIVEQGTTEQLSRDHPYLVLLQVYVLRNMFDDASKLLETIKQQYPLVPGVDEFVAERKREIETLRAQAARNDSAAAEASKGKQ
ncbi:MAG TPA: DUF2723 domain-containing protein [Bacteroidota bacterium]